MYYIKLLNIIKIKTIQDIWCLSTDSSIVPVNKYSVSVFQCNFRPSILAIELFTFIHFDSDFFKYLDHIFCIVIISKISHVCRFLDTETLCISTQINTISAWIHCLQMLIHINYIITKT